MTDINMHRERLVTFSKIKSSRDRLVVDAFAAGIRKWDIHALSGVSLATIDRILKKEAEKKQAGS